MTKAAFASMEMMLPVLPEPLCGANFRGGLGILAGDIMAGMCDTGIRAVGFTPLYHRPWFQKNVEVDYQSVPLWKKIVISVDSQDYIVSVHEIEINDSVVYGFESPDVFDVLYTENRQKRLLQEIVFAKVIAEVLKDIRFEPDIVWLNESHTAFLLPQLREDSYFENTKVLFTIHTPEQAGMEKYYEYRFEQLGMPEDYKPIFVKDGLLDLTWASMVLADHVNAVSREHSETTKLMFTQFRSKISGITNGSDSKFWMHPDFQKNKDKIIATKDASLVLDIHSGARTEAFEALNVLSGVSLDPNKPTAWFVRRFAAYKNLYSMIRNILPAICADRGTKVNTEIGILDGLGMQLVGAGMASENDNTCLWWIGEFTRLSREDFNGRFVFLPQYSLDLLKMGARGSDIWLVTPEPVREACGTSDQRAAINGIPSLTTKTGGMKEYITEFDTIHATGNGFFIEPYDQRTVYDKLKTFSDLWYIWKEKNDPRYGQLCLNVFLSGLELDIRVALKKYENIMKRMV